MTDKKTNEPKTLPKAEPKAEPKKTISSGGGLPTKKTMAITDPAKLSVLIYGQPKIGKTTFCSQLDNALFIATEPGTKTLDTYEVNVTSWKTFIATCNLIAKGDHNYKTIIIDTIDKLFWLCSEYVKQKHGLEHESDAGFGKGYAFVMNEFMRALIKLEALPYGLVLVSHSQQIEVEDRTSKYQRIVPTLTGKSKKFISGFVDMILYFDTVIKTIEGETKEIRVIRTKPSKHLEAGDRTGKLPEVLKMDVDVFMEKMGVAVGGGGEGRE